MLESGQHRPYHWEQPFLHFTHAGKQASWLCFQENYNLLTLMLATNFSSPPPKKDFKWNLHSNVLESAFSLQVFVSGLDLGVQWGQRGVEYMLVDFKRDSMHTKHADTLEKTLILGKTEGRGEAYEREWDGWMTSPSRWIWAWASSGSWWWTGKPGWYGFLSMALQRDGHKGRTELKWTNWEQRLINLIASSCWLANYNNTLLKWL